MSEMAKYGGIFVFTIKDNKPADIPSESMDEYHGVRRICWRRVTFHRQNAHKSHLPSKKKVSIPPRDANFLGSGTESFYSSNRMTYDDVIDQITCASLTVPGFLAKG